MFEAFRSSVGSGSVLSISGDLDLATLGGFRGEVLRAIDDVGPSLVLDLSAVDIFETVSWGVVFEAVKRSARAGGSITLVVPPGPMAEDLGFLGLDRVLTVVPTLDRAVDVHRGPERG